jgi:hypothetical protein
MPIAIATIAQIIPANINHCRGDVGCGNRSLKLIYANLIMWCSTPHNWKIAQGRANMSFEDPVVKQSVCERLKSVILEAVPLPILLSVSPGAGFSC